MALTICRRGTQRQTGFGRGPWGRTGGSAKFVKLWLSGGGVNAEEEIEKTRYANTRVGGVVWESRYIFKF